jgi:hypothetical protein
MERSPLQSTLQPVQAGFFTHKIARIDQTAMNEDRIQQDTSSMCPDYFLQVKHLKIASVTTKVWNVYSEREDQEEVNREMKEAYNTTNFRQYYTWQEFQSLQPSQQLAILQIQNQFNTEMRSLIIPGFSTESENHKIQWTKENEITPKSDIPTEDTQDDTVMTPTDIITPNESLETPNVTTTVLTDYIHRAFLSGDNTPIFDHVYSPCNGKCEVLVRRSHVPEAMGLIKVIRTELCREMPGDLAYKVFDDAEALIELGYTTPAWRPFDIQLQIPPALTTITTANRTSYNNKRSQRQQPSPSHSYAQALKHRFIRSIDANPSNSSRPTEPTVASTLTTYSLTNDQNDSPSTQQRLRNAAPPFFLVSNTSSNPSKKVFATSNQQSTKLKQKQILPYNALTQTTVTPLKKLLMRTENNYRN